MQVLTDFGIVVLRDLAWRIWDPIGILASGEDWRGKSFQDEYDSYIITAFEMLHRGVPKYKVLEFLQDAELKTMGLGSASTNLSIVRGRISELVDAIISADPRLRDEIG